MDNARVTVISDTVQEFLGERFYLCGNYFQHKGKRLHRAVWQHHHGEIPAGYHVHHADENKGNNQPENLVLMCGLEHIKGHSNTERSKENGRRAIKAAQAVAPEWHKSEAGTEWHSQHAKAFWGSVEPKEYVCAMCGRTFSSRDMRHKDKHFCGQNCRLKYNRRRRAATA